MEGKKCFAVVGSDARQAAAARALARAGYSVGGPEMIAVADYILLPLPLDAARTPLAELLRAARPGTLALGGMLSVEAKAIAAEAGVELVDYFAREELTIRNAIPTAEGCIGILMKERSRTLWGSSILLTGFGPVGQALGAVLNAEIRFAADSNAGRGPCIRRFLTLVLECDCDGVDEHRRTVPGVHAEFCHAAVRRLAGGHTQDGQGLGRRLGIRVGAGQRQADIAD